MKFKLVYTLILLAIAACTTEMQENGSTPEKSEFDFFVKCMDSILIHSLGKDSYDYYQTIKKDSCIIQRLTNSEVVNEIERYYVGELYLGDMPMSCKLYELNFQGSENEKEFVGVLESSPLIDGSIELFIFNSDRKLIGTHGFSAFRNEDSNFSFVDLNGDKNYEIIVDADIYRSVYDNKAKHIVDVENDSSSIVFSEVTYFYDNQRFDEDYNYMDSCDVQFIDESGNYPRIEIETKRYKISKTDEKTELIETKKETHHWNEERLRYLKR